jgi:pyruvate/2-oxoglutarate dehydrogenase complex dihydrolipoamide acyltransferase (E2) component
VASTHAKAVLRETALKRMEAAMARISEATGVEAAALPTHHRDAAYLEAQRLDTLATWLEQVVEAVSADAPPAPDYASMTAVELRRLLDERGIVLEEGSGAGGGIVKADLVAALVAADKADNADIDGE